MSEDAAARLKTALDLFEVGQDLMRARFRRENPEWDEQRLTDEIRTWLRHRPGALDGDYPGPRSTRQLRGLA